MASNRPMPASDGAPRLAPHIRLSFDRARQRHVLLAPESVTVLNGTGTAILRLCDGRRTVAGIVAELHAEYDHVDPEQVRRFLGRLAGLGYLRGVGG
jgi:pyrroloquinoline quinone biosynthesis protein D